MNLLTRSYLIALFVTLTGITAEAKRLAPKPVAPVQHEGIEFRAPLGVDKMGIVQAMDIKTQKIIWQAKLYTIEFDPNLERDVQWVFISDLKIEAGLLKVTNERGQLFTLDPATGKLLRKTD